MFRILWQVVWGAITLLIALAGLYVFVTTHWPKFSQDGRLAVVFLSLLFAGFLLENIRLKSILTRDARYSEGLHHLNEGFSKIHHVENEEMPELNTVISACEHLCKDVAHVFTLITGTPCSVSIKTLAKGSDPDAPHRLKAETFARDRRGDRGTGTVENWIDKNSDFLHILEKIGSAKGKYFFSNNLPGRKNYRNTSFAAYGEPPEIRLLRYWRWPLPYKSTVVVPICPSGYGSSSTLLGFLCVDSPNLGAFKKDHDVDLLQGVADGLFNLLNRMLNVNQTPPLLPKTDL